MKFPSLSISTTTALFGGLLVGIVEGAVFDMHLPNVGYVRADPILDQQCLSGHVHAFYGAKSLWPDTTGQDLQDISPYEVSGNIKEN